MGGWHGGVRRHAGSPHHLQFALRGSPLEYIPTVQLSSEAAAFSRDPGLPLGTPDLRSGWEALAGTQAWRDCGAPLGVPGATGLFLRLRQLYLGSKGDPLVSPSLDSCWLCHPGPLQKVKGLENKLSHQEAALQ